MNYIYDPISIKFSLFLEEIKSSANSSYLEKST